MAYSGICSIRRKRVRHMQHAPSTDPEEHRELERSRLQESLAATPERYVRPRAVVSAAWLSGAAVDGSIIDESGALAIVPVDTNIIYVGTSKQYQHLLQLPTRPGTNAAVQHGCEDCRNGSCEKRHGEHCSQGCPCCDDDDDDDDVIPGNSGIYRPPL